MLRLAFLKFVCLFLLALNVQAETLSLCAYFNWSPWIYANNHSYDGILMEQLTLFKEKNPAIEVNIVEIDNWKRCQIEVANGNISMILGANKTPEREKQFDYLPRPAVINRSSIEAYALKNKFAPINSLNDLKSYSLSFARGDSFGFQLDKFISQLPEQNIHPTNSIYQSMKMVELSRVDYFLSVSTSYKSTLETYNKEHRVYDHSVFEKVYTHERAIPVFFVFGKRDGAYAKYADKWLDVIDEYHRNTNIEERILHHVRRSGN